MKLALPYTLVLGPKKPCLRSWCILVVIILKYTFREWKLLGLGTTMLHSLINIFSEKFILVQNNNMQYASEAGDVKFKL